MAKSSTPSYVVTRRIYVEPWQAEVINRKMDLGNRMYSISPGWSVGRKPRRILCTASRCRCERSPLPKPCPAAKLPSGTICSKRNTQSSAGRCGIAHRPAAGSCRRQSCSTPDGSGCSPASSVPGSCGKVFHPVFAPTSANFYVGYLSCSPSAFCSIAVLSERATPFLEATRRAPRTSGQLGPKSAHGDASFFRTVMQLSRCAPPMDCFQSTRS